MTYLTLNMYNEAEICIQITPTLLLVNVYTNYLYIIDTVYT